MSLLTRQRPGGVILQEDGGINSGATSAKDTTLTDGEIATLKVPQVEEVEEGVNGRVGVVRLAIHSDSD